MAVSCGLDFGTSNSCVAMNHAEGARLVPVEQGDATIPSAIFFSFEGERPTFGRQAIEDYVEGEPGRLMRAIKSIIGSDLITSKTQIGNRRISFDQVVGLFLAQLKRRAETQAGAEIDSVVLGRPVEFVGATTEAEQDRAAAILTGIAREQGFRHVETQFEPIAAALHYEAQVGSEELVLVVDIGGGTSDFSLVRVSPERRRAHDRSGDILGNSGVAIGGTNFDQTLTLQEVMPLFGFREMVRREMGEELLEAPRSIYLDLATWHRIIFAYTRDNQKMARDLRRQALNPAPFARLERLLEEKLGHQITGVVEEAKIRLSDSDETGIELSFVEPGLSRAITRETFEALTMELAERIVEAIDRVLAQAQVSRQEVGAVFMTGGSANIPLLKAMVQATLPEAALRFGDMFGSVGLGLALDAQRRFG